MKFQKKRKIKKFFDLGSKFLIETHRKLLPVRVFLKKLPNCIAPMRLRPFCGKFDWWPASAADEPTDESRLAPSRVAPAESSLEELQFNANGILRTPKSDYFPFSFFRSFFHSTTIINIRLLTIKSRSLNFQSALAKLFTTLSRRLCSLF